MIKFYSPNDEVELALIKSILESNGVSFFVHNDHYGSLINGPRIGLLNAKTVFVSEDSAEKAQNIISEYLKNSQDHKEGEYKSNYSITDKIRVIFEALIFGWFMPGKRWRKQSKDNSIKDNN